ncbi:c-type cytochrome [Acidiphilium sp.]|uniref:c-type cytochrome n=1 Tax=Acidiphilium sp. TaxID=527 RepID=UPI003D0422D8
MNFVSVRWVLAAVAIAAIASADAATPPQIASCAACHGAAGLGNAADGIPALAGLTPIYLSRQLHSFKTGTRYNAIMAEIAAPLTAADRAAIAAYYAALPVPAEKEPTPLPGGSGATLAMNGDWGHQLTGVPSCNSCHGPYGVGVGAAFPRLAGQPKAYLAAQLVDWQKGSRKNDPLHMMRNVASEMSAAQIDAVAGYYAALSANPTDLPKPGDAKGAP